MNYPSLTSDLPPSAPSVQIAGHRGSSRLENSLADFQNTLQCGAIGIEFDIQLSKDKVPMVIHDHTLERTSTGTGYVSDYSCHELKQFNLKNKEGISKEVIPTLEEVLTLAEHFHHLIPNIWLNIEIKDPQSTQFVIEVVNRFLNRDLLKRHNMIISSFDHAVLYDIRAKEPAFALGILFDDTDSLNSIKDIERLIKDLNPVSLHLNQYQIKHEAIQRITSPITLVTWFSQEPPFPQNLPLIDEVVTLGAEIIITNHPYELVQHMLHSTPIQWNL